MAYNFIKVSLIQILVVTNNYQIIYLTETYLLDPSIIYPTEIYPLYPSIDNDDNRMSIPGYNLLRVDQREREGVCIYYKDHLPIMKRNDLCHLHECLVTELRLRKKKCFSTCLCRSLSQKSGGFLHRP